MELTRQNRNTYFIKKEFQTKIIAQFVMLVIAGSFISGLLLYFSDFKGNRAENHEYVL